MISLTTNGIVRWKLSLERDEDMTTVGITNIVAAMDGTLYYALSWLKNDLYLNKICRILDSETDKPVTTCSSNTLSSLIVQDVLSVDDSFEFLTTTFFGEKLGIINTSDLQVNYHSQQETASSFQSHYNSDQTGFFWISDDNHLRKVNRNGIQLLDKYVSSGGNKYYAYDAQYGTIIRVWQNLSLIPSPFAVSAWNINTLNEIHLLWEWNQFNYTYTTGSHPVIDPISKTTYFSILPNLYAIDSNGKTLWKTQIASQEEIDKFELITTCIALNTETRIAYIPIRTFHSFNPSAPAMLFLVPVQTNDGKALPRIKFDLDTNASVFLSCPILVGNELLYFSWYSQSSSDTALLRLVGISQIQA